MSLRKLQQKVLAERAKILEEIDDEYARKEIGEKLNSIYEELKEVNAKLSNIHRRNANVMTVANSNSRPTSRAPAPLPPVRQRVHPELKALGIHPSASQRPGAYRVPLGTKIKKDRRTRRNRRA
jgi:hypothetical protein